MMCIRFSKAALQTLHSAQLAMLFVQVVENPNLLKDPDSVLSSDIPLSSVYDTDVVATHESSKYELNSLKDQALMGTGSHYGTMKSKVMKEGSDNEFTPINEETDLMGKERTVECAALLSCRNAEIVGEVNEVAVNAEAKRRVGDMRLVWKMAIGKNYQQRRLVLV